MAPEMVKPAASILLRNLWAQAGCYRWLGGWGTFTPTPDGHAIQDLCPSPQEGPTKTEMQKPRERQMGSQADQKGGGNKRLYNEGDTGSFTRRGTRKWEEEAKTEKKEVGNLG